MNRVTAVLLTLVILLICTGVTGNISPLSMILIGAITGLTIVNLVCLRPKPNPLSVGDTDTDWRLALRTDRIYSLFCIITWRFLLPVQDEGLIRYIEEEDKTTPQQRLYFLIRPTLVEQARLVIRYQEESRTPQAEDHKAKLESAQRELKDMISAVVAAGIPPLMPKDHDGIADWVYKDIFGSAGDPTYNPKINAFDHTGCSLPIQVKDVGKWPCPQVPVEPPAEVN